MDVESSNQNVPNGSTDENVDFSHVATIATRWMLDFSFVSLCRYFKEGKHDEFHRTYLTLEAIAQGSRLKKDHAQKMNISAFLARIMHGKRLDVFFEDDGVMPLMSATNIWTTLRDTVADEALHSSVATLLYIQSVVVCVEKGQKTMASSALKWLENKHDIPKNLAVKLSTRVTRMDIYHPFLRSFSYKRLLETVETFLDTFLQEQPSDFLLQAASKVAQSCKDKDSSAFERTESEYFEKPDESLSQSTDTSLKDFEEEKRTSIFSLKRRLFSNTNAELWNPKSCTKSRDICRPFKDNEMAEQTFASVLRETSLNTTEIRRSKKKWTLEMDRHLIKGVRKHGVGKWSRILLDHDFEGRTGTMLKDRWRVLKKSLVVS